MIKPSTSRRPGKAILAALALAVSTLAGGLSACSADDSADYPREPGTALGIDLAALDKTVKPGDDFFAYANGTWLRNARIPEDRAQVGAFSQAEQDTDRQLTRLIEDILKGDAAPDSNPGRIRTYYATYLDTAAIDAAGMAPVKADLERIAGATDVATLSRVLGQQLRADVDPLNATDFHTENLLGLFVTQSLTGEAVVPYLLQGGLGMPERAYYLSSDPRHIALREKYKGYIARMLAGAGIADAQAKAARIYALEQKIAAAHATREQSNDFQNAWSEWTRAELTAKAPGIDWDAFLKASGLAEQSRFIVWNPAAITRLSALVAREPVEAWQDWLTFHQINIHAQVLPQPLRREHFAFYDTELKGTPQEPPRERRARDALNAALGDAVGRLYVEQYFPPASRRRVEAMVGNLKQAFVHRIRQLDWMAPETREQAVAKVAGMEVGIGYPDTWKDYSAFTVLPGQAYANEVAAGKVRTAQQLAKLGKPQDRREWWMNAQLVNAVNLPVQNALNFPAAILKKPFFDPAADPAANYGAIGAIIGHEISHSFDDNGAAFDAQGKLRNWWTAADLARFQRDGKALVAQYDSYRPFPDARVNGRLTLGENIADVAGLAAAYDAYRASLKGKEPPVIEGFTGDQRFFIAYAQGWAMKSREAALRGRLATDSHAPAQFRAQTVRNIDAWYRAFDVQPGDRLYLPPEKRVRIW